MRQPPKGRAERGIVDRDQRPQAAGRILREQQRLMAVVVGVTEHLLPWKVFRETSRPAFVCRLRRAAGARDRAADELVEGAFLQFVARNLYMLGDLTLSDTYSRLSAVLDKSLAIRIFYLGLPGTLTAPVIGRDIKHPRAGGTGP